MAKPKRPRIGKQPRDAAAYLVEVIFRTTTEERTGYHHFDDFRKAFDHAELEGAGPDRLARVFRVTYKLVKEVKRLAKGEK